MNIAIIGAGLAGLACANVLEKNGIAPVIFEKTDFIGEREPHVGADLHVMNRPVKDMLEYIRENYKIDIIPLNTVNKLTHYSPSRKTSITGKFGYFTRRDREGDSIKHQLYSQLQKTEIKFSTEANYKDLSNKFDYVVVADGKPDVPEELGCWTDWISGFIKGAVIEGNFDANELIMWLNKKYCRNGYAYLTPFSSGRASLNLYVPCTDFSDIDMYWDLFLQQENLKYEIVETFKVFHASGRVYPHKVNNILLAGNSGGAMDPFLGFGQFKSVLMGGAAALSIVEGLDYDTLIDSIDSLNIRLYELRKAFDNATNRHYDMMIAAIGIPIIKAIIYETPLNVIKYGAATLKLKRKITGGHK